MLGWIICGIRNLKKHGRKRLRIGRDEKYGLNG